MDSVYIIFYVYIIMMDIFSGAETQNTLEQIQTKTCSVPLRHFYLYTVYKYKQKCINRRASTGSVSYTHLDVYKRQESTDCDNAVYKHTQ